MRSINLKSSLLILAIALLFMGLSSCRTHNGGRACPSYGSINKTEKPA